MGYGTDFEEVFAGAIDADGFTDGRMTTDDIVGPKSFASLEADVGHLIKRADTTDIEPFGQLLACELGQADTQGNVLQFRQRLAKQDIGDW